MAARMFSGRFTMRSCICEIEDEPGELVGSGGARVATRREGELFIRKQKGNHHVRCSRNHA
jgi:hypothetical protein